MEEEGTILQSAVHRVAGITITTVTAIMKGAAGVSAHEVSSVVKGATPDKGITMVMTEGVVIRAEAIAKMAVTVETSTMAARLRVAMTGARVVLVASAVVDSAARAHQEVLVVVVATGVVVSVALHPHAGSIAAVDLAAAAAAVAALEGEVAAAAAVAVEAVVVAAAAGSIIC